MSQDINSYEALVPRPVAVIIVPATLEQASKLKLLILDRDHTRIPGNLYVKVMKMKRLLGTSDFLLRFTARILSAAAQVLQAVR